MDALTRPLRHAPPELWLAAGATVLIHALLWLAFRSIATPEPPVASDHTRIVIEFLPTRAPIAVPPIPDAPRRLVRARPAPERAPAPLPGAAPDAAVEPSAPGTTDPFDPRRALQAFGRGDGPGGAAVRGPFERAPPRLPGRDEAFVDGVVIRGSPSPQQVVNAVGAMLFGAVTPAQLCADVRRMIHAERDPATLQRLFDRERRHCR